MFISCFLKYSLSLIILEQKVYLVASPQKNGSTLEELQVQLTRTKHEITNGTPDDVAKEVSLDFISSRNAKTRIY